MKTIDLTGYRFGRLFVVRRAQGKSTRWLCRCDCGEVATVMSQKLRIGNTSSCGCLQRELLAARNRTHGKSRTKEYRIWKNMMTRCTNAHRPAFIHYGGRGIGVCERWQNSFDSFLSDMGAIPSSSHTLERKDNGLGYSPENCCWASRAEQSRNRRNVVRIEWNGRSLCAKEWSRIVGISDSTIRRRYRAGFSPDQILSS